MINDDAAYFFGEVKIISIMIVPNNKQGENRSGQQNIFISV